MNTRLNLEQKIINKVQNVTKDTAENSQNSSLPISVHFDPGSAEIPWRAERVVGMYLLSFVRRRK